MRPALFGPRRTRAQALVEAALIFPIMVLLLIGVADFGRAFYHHIVLATAVREGARVGSGGADDARIVAVVEAAAPPGLIKCCTITPPFPRKDLRGQTISVTGTYEMTLITPGMSTLMAPLLVNGKLVLTQTARMVIM